MTSNITDIYPPGTVRDLLSTNLVTQPTRAALQARLDETPGEPRFFTKSETDTLEAALKCLFADPEAPTARSLALCIDDRLADQMADGWRYDSMPPDGEAFKMGLRGLNEAAAASGAATFTALARAAQEAVLKALDTETVAGDVWQTLPSKLFLEEVLSDATHFFYSHPLVQEEIGYAGMADAPGWSRFGLNVREPREPLPMAATEPAATTPAPPPPPLPTPTPPLSTGRQFPLSETVDAVIIGTGAGGAPILARLASAGLSVVALEAGHFWDPARDFATDERAQDKLFWNDERLSAGRDPVPFGANNSGIGVGGSTLHYTAYTPRAHPDDFTVYSEFGVSRDWPIGYADLEPYYNEVELFLGVSGPTPYPWNPHGQGYPLPALPLNGAALLMQGACDRLGIKTSPAPNAALSGPYFQPGVGWRKACTNRGFCQAGCSVGAKASMDVTFIPVALQAGAEVRSECFVTTIERDAQGRVSGVVYNQHGTERRQPCRNVFLCAGAIESPRLLMLNNLGNSSGEVGRNFTTHTGIQVWGQFDADIRPYKGIPGGLISEDTHRPKDADFASGYLLQSIGVMPVTYATQLVRGEHLWGEGLRQHMRGYNHVAGINICGDGLAYEHNFVELSDEKDIRGLPKPRVHYTAGENENRMTVHAETLMRQIWAEAGAKDVWSLNRHPHTLGTCRMGNNPADSVVDSYGRSHDVPGLHIMDNSVFPSALSINPALTQMALSLRAADHFLATR